MDCTIKNLGSCDIPSPFIDKFPHLDKAFISDTIKMRYRIFLGEKLPPEEEGAAFELAGQRRMIHFKPEETVAAVVTCGGLCPGLNDVIRSIVMECYYQYGVKKILGIRYGYNGLNPAKGWEPVQLTPDLVEDIHRDGGTILSSSRGGTDNMDLLVDTLESWRVNILFTIGGDGTLNGAHQIAGIALKRGLDMVVVGVPKTIDNDISYIQRSFGFQTAFSAAVDAIYSAHVEAKGAPNGIGIVKLMGRHSGFIAANASLAMNDVNFILVPEVPFDLEGPNGLFAHLEKRILSRHHAVICVAEGAGQDLLNSDHEGGERDRSGNLVLKDIGIYLKDKIKDYFRQRDLEVNIKYIDPSYIIRSQPACAEDSIFCALLGQYAVHAGMAGKTDLVIGQWNNIYAHVPIELAVSKRKRINPESQFWHNVLQATGQPANMKNP
ncbi:MAG: ATP-dependent 6-phosphofructokinase [Spirochaetales bacterium]|nr:ATP-dependent 6-phosphofructokinase [Spirochaetales bacterium]